jgi:hypothetical protein
MKRLVLILLLIASVLQLQAQQKYTPQDIHSHNDYLQATPFYHAFKAGVGAIEADVFLRNGKLMVSHDTAGIRPEFTLKKMYLDPLRNELENKPRPVKLVIDLKETYGPILAELLRELEPLKLLIKTGISKAPLSIIITGNRPTPAEYNSYPAYVMFDDDLQLAHDTEQWKRVAQVSLNFANYSKWKGDGVLPLKDDKLIRAMINAVHIAGKRIRFWGAPDKPAAWEKLIALKADILSTDKIDELVSYIK